MKKGLITLSILIPFLFLAVWTYIEIPFVSREAIDHAKEALERHEGSLLNSGTLIIVDFSRPSHTKRFATVDLKTGTLGHYARVAHGKNSGVVYANEFSNEEGSFQSSLGLFKVTESFEGAHGSSFRLMGLEPGKNDHAFERGIIVHSAPYVSTYSMLLNWKSGFRLGRSEGCFVLSDRIYKNVFRQLTRPAYLYAYGNEE